MLPSQGSLMNYLALVAEQYYPEIAKLSEAWVAIWVAADVSFKQLQTDVNQLEVQFNKVNAEFTRLKPGKENPGLDGQMEDLNGPVIKPLHNKLNTFLQAAKPRLQNVKDTMKSLESDLEKCMNVFGESLKALSEEDPSKKFFSTIVEFAKAFQTALDDNLAKRQAHEKAAKALAEAEQKVQSQASPVKLPGFQLPPLPLKSPLKPAQPAPPTDNLFGQFHKSQTASPTDLLAEFKSKLNKQKMADS